ncbi:MAG: 50S ribosomal protein L24 [Clostridia bacterium]|nr:50S ribosomal protein L24 [Clostridia bacterium]
MHVKRGDTVKVIAGKDKGREVMIIEAIPAKNKVIVEGVAVAQRHQKARVQGQESGIIHKEMPIDASIVMRVCSKCGKAARTGVRVLADGSKVRYCKKCDAEISD